MRKDRKRTQKVVAGYPVWVCVIVYVCTFPIYRIFQLSLTVVFSVDLQYHVSGEFSQYLHVIIQDFIIMKYLFIPRC